MKPVAAVVAEDRYTAKRAAELIDVSYEELPVVSDAEAALQPGAPVVQPGAGMTNIMIQVEFSQGDVATALREADGTVDGCCQGSSLCGVAA